MSKSNRNLAANPKTRTKAVTIPLLFKLRIRSIHPFQWKLIRITVITVNIIVSTLHIKLIHSLIVIMQIYPMKQKIHLLLPSVSPVKSIQRHWHSVVANQWNARRTS
uniref:Uncharacterized protein n=1 Tax=Cacopsylla melanoneura TaxID=428564 RepID=A0A8D8V8X6_9HEMI